MTGGVHYISFWRRYYDCVFVNSALMAKQRRLISKSLRLTSIRTPNVFGGAIRQWALIPSTENTCTSGTRSKAGQKGMCTVVVSASAGNSAQNVPSRQSNPSGALERMICCQTVSSIDSGGSVFDILCVVDVRRDVHSTATSRTRKILTKPTLASGGRQTVPITAQKQANQNDHRTTCNSCRRTSGKMQGGKSNIIICACFA